MVLSTNMALGKNIKKFREEYGLTQEQLAGAAGVSQGVVSAIERRDSKSSAHTNAFAKALGLTVDDLLSGRKATPRNLSNDKGGLIVPILDVSASMGTGAHMPELETVIDHIRLHESWVRTNLPTLSGPKNLACLSAYGDSMAPTFSDGDILLVDRGVITIRLDAVYVMAISGELYVKRVQRRPDGSIAVISDNAVYQPVVISNGEREGLQVLGRVLWAWNGRRL